MPFQSATYPAHAKPVEGRADGLQSHNLRKALATGGFPLPHGRGMAYDLWPMIKTSAISALTSGAADVVRGPLLQAADATFVAAAGVNIIFKKYRSRVYIGVYSGRGQNRTLRPLSTLRPPVFAGEQDVGPHPWGEMWAKSSGATVRPSSCRCPMASPRCTVFQ